MSTRTMKQIMYGAFYAVIWILVIWGVYAVFFHLPAATCFDGKQDGGETGVDCGGPCAKVCATSNIQPIAVVGVNIFTAKNGNETFLAKIANTNADDGAQSFDYNFNTYDESGTLLQSFPGSSFLYPDEAKYLLLANQPVSGLVASANLSVTAVDWVASTTMGLPPGLSVGAISTQVASTTVTAGGTITNGDTVEYANVILIGVFKDANGNPIGASQTEITNLAPGASQNFSIIYPAVSGINPAATEVEAYTDD